MGCIHHITHRPCRGKCLRTQEAAEEGHARYPCDAQSLVVHISKYQVLPAEEEVLPNDAEDQALDLPAF